MFLSQEVSSCVGKRKGNPNQINVFFDEKSRSELDYVVTELALIWNQNPE